MQVITGITTAITIVVGDVLLELPVFELELLSFVVAGAGPPPELVGGVPDCVPLVTVLVWLEPAPAGSLYRTGSVYRWKDRRPERTLLLSTTHRLEDTSP